MPKGKYKRTDEIKMKISKALKGRFKDEEHSQWKGDSATRRSIHKWLYRNYGYADRCENKNCRGLSLRYEWANIKNHRYSHNRKDYVMLCTRCHSEMDHGDYCGKGHRYTEDNVYRDKKGQRHCRICRKKWFRDWYERNRI